MENLQVQNQADNQKPVKKKASSSKRRIKSADEIKHVYLNEMPELLFEKALAKIFARKILNGTLDMTEDW
jgi:hypothetical protein